MGKTFIYSPASNLLTTATLEMKFASLITLFVIALFFDSAYSDPIYPTPFYPVFPVRSYTPPQPAYQPESYPAQPYNFEWAVKDEPSYNDYSHSESSDGKVTIGSYRVVLPDGRTQIVSYKADINGYVADVNYVGEDKYDTPAAYSAPAYKSPVPVYRAQEAPVYQIPIVPVNGAPAPVYRAPIPAIFRSIAPAY